MMHSSIVRLALRACTVTAMLAVLACSDTTFEPDIPPTPTLDAQLRQQIAQWGVVPILPVAAQPPALVELGQALMFDKLLSGNRDVSCGSCHDPLRAGTDGLSLAVGTGASVSGTVRVPGAGRSFGPRNATSLLNVGLGGTYLFWDARLVQQGGFGPLPLHNRVASPPGLEDALITQAFSPIVNRHEMRGQPGDLDRFGNPNELAAIPDDKPEEVWRAVMRRVIAVPEYVTRFKAAFPTVPVQSFSFEHAARAMVSTLR